MKITIVTPVFNCGAYINNCIASVISQDYASVEYIVIDGGSVDNTLAVLEQYREFITCLVSEKDEGMYDAINKGLKLATGDVVGILNADDYFSGPDVISAIANCFNRMDCDAVYGNLNYVSRRDGQSVQRRWRSGIFSTRSVLRGWMPAHPTFYVRRSVYAQFGFYKPGYGTCGDFELMLRFLYVYKIRAFFLDKLLVNMRTGGRSSGGIKGRWKSMKNDYRILVEAGLPRPLFTLVLKKLKKLCQFV